MAQCVLSKRAATTRSHTIFHGWNPLLPLPQTAYFTSIMILCLCVFVCVCVHTFFATIVKPFVQSAANGVRYIKSFTTLHTTPSQVVAPKDAELAEGANSNENVKAGKDALKK